jgi:7-carboxy-7-deazaguanine synthase
MNRITYPVNEVFRTVQGEATFAGTPSVFIRMQGCGVGCPWCDTKHTWDFDNALRMIPIAQLVEKVDPNPLWASFTVEALVAEVVRLDARHVVLTGGEPCVHDLAPLCKALEATGRTVQIETSGTEPIRAPTSTWVTVSPKIRMPGKKQVRPDALRRADEVKHPVATERNVEELLALLDGAGIPASKVWLQPVDGSRRGHDIALAACYTHGFRLSVQTHKLIGLR